MTGEKQAKISQHMSSKFSLFLTVMLFGSFILTYFQVWKDLVLYWYNADEYSHGFLIPPLCLYLLWRKKQVFAETPFRPSGAGLVLIVFSLLLYVFAHYAEISTVKSFSMALLLAGVVIYFYGFLMFKELLFPFFVMFFMIPIPSQIYSSLTIPLQLFVTKTSVWMAYQLGLPIYREGNIIHLPDRALQVVQACSGLRSMISLLALSAVFAYFALKSNFLRTLLFLSAVPAAIFVNIVRVLLLVLAFHHSTYDLTTGSTHTVFGILIFMLALVFVAIVSGVLSIWDRPKTEST